MADRAPASAPLYNGGDGHCRAGRGVGVYPNRNAVPAAGHQRASGSDRCVDSRRVRCSAAPEGGALCPSGPAKQPHGARGHVVQFARQPLHFVLGGCGDLLLQLGLLGGQMPQVHDGEGDLRGGRVGGHGRDGDGRQSGTDGGGGGRSGLQKETRDRATGLTCREANCWRVTNGGRRATNGSLMATRPVPGGMREAHHPCMLREDFEQKVFIGKFFFIRQKFSLQKILIGKILFTLLVVSEVFLWGFVGMGR